MSASLAEVPIPESLVSSCFGNQCIYNSSDVIRPSYRQQPNMLGWNVPPDELQHIPEHWLKYPEPDAELHYLLGIIYILFTIVSLTGNGIVIWIFITAKQLRTASNMFVVNLAIADFLMMSKTPIFIYNSFHTGFALGKFYCDVFGVVGSIAGISQAATNSAIAYDRYKAISDPMNGKISKGKAIAILLFIYAWLTPWVVMPALEIWGRFVPEGFLTSCTFDYLTTTMENKMFVFFIFIFSYCFPMFCTIFFYSQIVGHVVDHEKALKAQAKKMNVESLRSGDQSGPSAEVRICKAAIGICSLFVASWTPYAVFALIGAFGNQDMLTPGLTMIPALCCKAVACLDPYVYAISHPKFRQELDKMFPWLKINEPATPSDKGSTTTSAAPQATTTT